MEQHVGHFYKVHLQLLVTSLLLLIAKGEYTQKLAVDPNTDGSSIINISRYPFIILQSAWNNTL